MRLSCLQNNVDLAKLVHNYKQTEQFGAVGVMSYIEDHLQRDNRVSELRKYGNFHQFSPYCFMKLTLENYVSAL